MLKRYEGERAAIQKEAEQQVCARRQKLIEELKPLQDKYTREAKLDEAVAIRDLIRTLQEPVENVLPDPGARTRIAATSVACFTFVSPAAWAADPFGAPTSTPPTRLSHWRPCMPVCYSGPDRGGQGDDPARTIRLPGIDSQWRDQCVLRHLSQLLQDGTHWR